MPAAVLTNASGAFVRSLDGGLIEPAPALVGAVRNADASLILNTGGDALNALPVGWVDLGSVGAIAGVSTADGRKIGALAEWHGRIYLGYGDYDLNQPSGGVHILAWDESTSAIVDLGTLNTNSGVDLRVVDDELWIVANDMNAGTHHHYGVIDASHAYTDVNPGNTVNAYHLFDSAYFSGAPFLCGASYVDGSCSKGTVWRHNGTAWSKVLELGSCPGVGRVYGLIVIGSTLYAKANGQTVRQTTDGTTWTTGSGLSTNQTVHPVSVSGGAIYKTAHWPSGVPTALIRYDGSSESTVIALASGVKSHCLAPDGTPFVLVGTEVRAGNAAGTSFSAILADAPSKGTALCVTDDAIYVGTADSHLWRRYR